MAKLPKDFVLDEPDTPQGLLELPKGFAIDRPSPRRRDPNITFRLGRPLPKPSLDKPISVKQRAQDITGIASEQGISLAEAEIVQEEQTWKQVVFGGLAKGGLQLAKSLANLPSHQLRLLEAASRATVEKASTRPTGMIWMPKEARDRLLASKSFWGFAEEQISPASAWLENGLNSIIRSHPEWQGKPADNVIDLILSPKKLANAIAQSIPVLLGAGLATATGHPIAALSIMYAAEGQEAYDEAIAYGATKEEAERAQVIYGSVAAAIEYAQVYRGLKLLKGTYQAVLSRSAQKVARTLAKTGQKTITKQLLHTVIEESVEEMAQGTWQEQVAKYVYGKEPEGGLLGFVDRRAQEAVIAATLTGLTGVGGAVAGATTQAITKERAERLPGKEQVQEKILEDYINKLEKAVEAGDIRKAQEAVEAKPPTEAIVAPEKPVEARKPVEAVEVKPFKAVVYRGISEKTPIATGLAEGLHYTTNKKLAQSFAEDYGKGELIEKEINLKKPFYLTDDARFGFDELEGISHEDRREGESLPSLMTRVLTERGYDGIVYEEGKEIIVFDKPKAVEEPTPTEPVDRANLIAESLKAAKHVVPEIVAEQKIELGRRVGAAAATMESLLEEGVPPGDAIDKSTAKLAGKLTKYTGRFESVREQLGEELIQETYRDIITNEKLQYLEKKNTKDAFDSLIDGDYLTVSEAQLIIQQFGVKSELGKMARRRIPASERLTRLIAEIAGIPTTLLTAASGDISGIGRQMRPLGQAYPVEYVKSIVKYVKSWGSERADIATAKETRDLPFYQEEISDGILEVPKYGEEIMEPMERGEEFIGARLVERVPGIGQLTKMAERGFVTGIGYMRSIVYGKIRKAAHKTTLEGTVYDSMTIKDRKRLASIINDASGRAHLKRTAALKRWGGFLRIFFAPQFRLARMRMPFRLPIELSRLIKRMVAPKKMYVMTLDTGEAVMRDERVETGKTIKGKGTVELVEEVAQRLNLPEIRLTTGAFASMIATNISLMYLVKMAYMGWGEDPDEFELEIDPRSKNSGKIRIRDMRIDLWAGYLQDVQDYAQFVTGTALSQAGEEYPIDRKLVLLRALRRRSSPLAGLVVDIFTEETVIGKRFGAPPKGKEGELLNAMQIPEYLHGATAEVWDRLVSLVLQDAMAAWIVEGVPEALTMGFLSHIGISVATYEKWGSSELTSLKNKIAQESYGKKWDALTEKQQAQFKPALEELKVLVFQEKPLRPRSRFITEEEEEISERMYRAMPKQIQEELYKIGTDAGGLSRRWGEFNLSRVRFEKYEELAIPQIERELDKLLRSSSYRVLRVPSEKRAKVQKKTEEAKERARETLRKMIDRGAI